MKSILGSLCVLVICLALLILIIQNINDSAVLKLQIDGYTNIHTYDTYLFKIGFGPFWGCGTDDIFATRFSAIKDSHEVKGTVCQSYSEVYIYDDKYLNR